MNIINTIIRLQKALLLCLMTTLPLTALAIEIPKYSVYEVSLTTATTHNNPYTDVTVSGTFSGPGTSITVRGFWDGGNVWKLRVAPTVAGTWTLTSVTSAQDNNLNGQKVGETFDVREPTAADIAANEVLRHGFVRVSPTYKRSFEHADGTPFLYLSDTLWGGRCILGTHYQTGKFQQIINFRASQGFTAITLCNIAAESNIANEGGGPFVSNHVSNVLNPAFFQWVDQRIDYMTRKGVRPTLMLGSPDAGLTSSTTWIDRFTTYLVARYAAYDVFWFGVKEFDEWTNAGPAINAYGNAVQTHDPYDHPTSTHVLVSTVQSNPSLAGQAWLDFNAIQFDNPSKVKSVRAASNKPILVAESHYRTACGYGGVWSYSNDNDVLVDVWPYYINNGVMGGQFIPCYNIDEYLANMDVPALDYLNYLQHFFTTYTDFQKLMPHPELINSGTIELAVQSNPNESATGLEYVGFMVNGGSANLNLGHASGTVYINWYNPKTGVYTNGGTVTAGINVAITAPSSTTSWVLHATATAQSPQEPPVGGGSSGGSSGGTSGGGSGGGTPVSPPPTPTGFGISVDRQPVTSKQK